MKINQLEEVIMRSFYTKFARERNSLSLTDTVSGVLCHKDKDIVRERISKMKNGRAAGTSNYGIRSWSNRIE